MLVACLGILDIKAVTNSWIQMCFLVSDPALHIASLNLIQILTIIERKFTMHLHTGTICSKKAYILRYFCAIYKLGDLRPTLLQGS